MERLQIIISWLWAIHNLVHNTPPGCNNHLELVMCFNVASLKPYQENSIGTKPWWKKKSTTHITPPDLDITEGPLDLSNFLQSVGDEDLGQNMLRPRTW